MPEILSYLNLKRKRDSQMPEISQLESSAIEIATDELESVLNLEFEDDMKKHTVKRETHDGIKETKRKKLETELTDLKMIAGVISQEIEDRQGELEEVNAVIKSVEASITCLDAASDPKVLPIKKQKKEPSDANHPTQSA